MMENWDDERNAGPLLCLEATAVWSFFPLFSELPSQRFMSFEVSSLPQKQENKS